LGNLELGFDAIRIADDLNLNTNIYSHLGENYKHSEYACGSIEAKSFLAGTHEFISVFNRPMGSKGLND
jgi:hypothetical protein